MKRKTGTKNVTDLLLGFGPPSEQIEQKSPLFVPRSSSARSFQIYRSGTVNSKSFVGKVLLRIKWKFELN